MKAEYVLNKSELDKFAAMLAEMQKQKQLLKQEEQEVIDYSEFLMSSLPTDSGLFGLCQIENTSVVLGGVNGSYLCFLPMTATSIIEPAIVYAAPPTSKQSQDAGQNILLAVVVHVTVVENPEAEDALDVTQEDVDDEKDVLNFVDELRLQLGTVLPTVHVTLLPGR